MGKVIECIVVEILSTPSFNPDVGYFEIDVKYLKSGGKRINKGVYWHPDINKIQEVKKGDKFYKDKP